MTGEKPKPPRGTKPSGRAVWRDVTDRFDLDTTEIAVLTEIVRTVDQLDRLAQIVAADGAMLSDGRLHPALVEARTLHGAGLVETRDQGLELGARHQLVVASHQLGLDVDHRVAAVEERHDLDHAAGQHDHRGRVAGGIAERQELLALVVDRKRLDGPVKHPVDETTVPAPTTTSTTTTTTATTTVPPTTAPSPSKTAVVPVDPATGGTLVGCP